MNAQSYNYILGASITALAFAAMLAAQSVSYKKLEATLVAEKTSTEFLASELERVDNLLVSARSDIARKNELINLVAPSVQFKTDILLGCKSAFLRVGMCRLWNTSDKGIVAEGTL